MINMAADKEAVLTVRKSVEGLRPYCVGGIIRDLEFTDLSLKSFMDLQDKLHHGLGKQRVLVSMGTHDLDKIQGPFEFTAEPLDSIKFVPLNLEKEMTGPEILEHYNQDSKMSNYTKIIPESSGLFPLIKDAKGNILSAPPLINSDLSKIDLNTKNVFIDITSTDETKALMALNVLVTLFGVYSKKPFSFQQVQIKYEHELGQDKVVPNFDFQREMTLSKTYIERLLGEKGISDSKVIESMLKMGLPTKVLESSSEDSLYNVHVPLHRTDILHQCDLAEDFAIAYGYNNINVTTPNVVSIGKEDRLNKLTEQFRGEISNAGYAECMTFALCSVVDLTKTIRVPTDDRIVHVGNPKASDFEALRTTLLPGLLKCLVSNKKNKLPLKLFELNDVILKVASEDDLKGTWNHSNIYDKSIGSVNQRRLGLVISNVNSSGLDMIHGGLDYIFRKLYLKGEYSYVLQKASNPFLFAGMQADIYLVDSKSGQKVFEERIGYMGIVHPEVLKNINWNYPVSCLELNFQVLAEKI
jgi:phenylalanyl-tRNA synthetase beta chain